MAGREAHVVHNALWRHLKAARIHYGKGAFGVFDIGVVKVAGHAGEVGYNGLFPPQYPVKERGFTYIGPADNGHEGPRGLFIVLNSHFTPLCPWLIPEAYL